MNIAFAKIGKSIKFVTAFSPIGGDNEAPSMLRILANHNPNITFHIVGRSDFSKLDEKQRLELFPYDNVIDAFAGHRGKADPDTILNYFSSFQPDAMVLMVGQVGNVSIPDRMWGQRDPTKTVSIIDMTRNYTTPITKWWNENPNIPVVEICNDPRYTMAQSKDTFADPIISLSQYDYKYLRTASRSYEDQTRTESEVRAVYAEMEKIFLYDRHLKSASAQGRNTNFMVVLNEGSPSRYKMLKEWVLDKVDDVEIYGKWDHEDALNDSRFKGSMALEDLQTKLQTVRSTFIIPIAKGWVTSKYIEMIHAGVIPFFHPTYDEQNNLNVPSFLRPKNNEELMTAVNALSDDNVYYKTISLLQDTYCKNEYYDGSKLNNNVMNVIDPTYKKPDLSQYEKKQAESFDLTDFFV